MGENQHNQQFSRFGLSRHSTREIGEIVEVEGGHIVRSTGRKDRHSKVCTAKGPRDRRVRLSAHTAIQFYDVQDRLGYDRPSKAVDWLIKKAKPAIDKLAELPPWNPTAFIPTQSSEQCQLEENQYHLEAETNSIIDGGSSESPMVAETPNASSYGFQFQHQSNNPSNNSSFLPPLDSDAIADTIRSFFPVVAASASSSSSSSLHFQNYPPDLLSRTSSQTQDLRLSLQSFQDPILLHHHSTPTPTAQQFLFSSSTPPAFDATSTTWSDQQQMWRFQRMIPWNANIDAGNGGGGEFVFNSPPLQPMLGQNPIFSQRGPLQSSNSPSVRAWIDPPMIATDHHQTYTMNPSSISCFGSSGFGIPARIQGEEEQDRISNKPSSASRH